MHIGSMSGLQHMHGTAAVHAYVRCRAAEVAAVAAGVKVMWMGGAGWRVLRRGVVVGTHQLGA